LIHQWSTVTGKSVQKLKNSVAIMGFDTKNLSKVDALAAMWKTCSKQSYARCQTASYKLFEQVTTSDTKISQGSTITEGKVHRVRDLIMKWSAFYEGKEAGLRTVMGAKEEIVRAQWMSALYKRLVYSLQTNKVMVEKEYDWFWETIKRYSRRKGAELLDTERPKDLQEMCSWADTKTSPLVSFSDVHSMITQAVKWLNDDIDNSDNWKMAQDNITSFDLPKRDVEYYVAKNIKIDEVKDDNYDFEEDDDLFSSITSTIEKGFADLRETKVSDKEKFYQTAKGLDLSGEAIADIIRSVTMDRFSDYDSAANAGYVLTDVVITRYFSKGVSLEDMTFAEKPSGDTTSFGDVS
jgi:hypothetical protein